jgi:hypothetical protein
MAGIDAYTVSCLHFENRVWTFAGTAQIDTAQKPFATGGSLLLDGNSDYLSTPYSADFDFGTGDFTVDCWIRVANAAAYQHLIGTDTTGKFMLAINQPAAGGELSLGRHNVAWDASAAHGLSNNTWAHIAVCRSGTDLFLFVNGVPLTGMPVTDNQNYTTAVTYMGAMPTVNYLNGNIGEVRITKGLARWTADFSASLPTSKYADDVQDPILGTWNPSDKSASVTLSNGDLTATNAGASWSSARSTVGKSSGKWYWEYTIASLGYVEVGAGISTSALDGRFVNPWGTGWGGQSNVAGFGAGDVVQVAIDIDGGNIWVGKNGAWNGGGNPSTGANPFQTGVSGTIYPMVTVYQAESTVNLGASAFQYQPPVGFNGLYTVSLLHFDEADGSTFTKDVAANWSMDGAAQFYDESGKVWTAAGDAQLDTAQKKWMASGLFDGTVDKISTTASVDLQFDADFTIDFWMRQSSQTALQRWFATRDSDSALFQMFSENGNLQVCDRNITGTLPAAGNWAHIALVRYSGNIKLYVNGTQSGSTWACATNFNDNYGFFLGRYHNNDGFYGWIDEFRISKGIARWTEDFTPPTVEYATVVEYIPPTISTVDTFNAPTINTAFIPTIASVDTFNTPSVGRAIPIPNIVTADTFNAPTKYTITYHVPTIYTNDAFNAPTTLGAVINQKITFPNLSGRKLSIEFIDNDPLGGSELYHIRVKMFRSNDRTDHYDNFPIMGGTHLGLELVQTTNADLDLAYISIGMLRKD